MVLKCCPARISVGAMMAAWNPLSTAVSMAVRDTTVLPEPTSPWRRRLMGWGCFRSAWISCLTLSWAAVSLKGSDESSFS